MAKNEPMILQAITITTITVFFGRNLLKSHPFWNILRHHAIVALQAAGVPGRGKVKIASNFPTLFSVCV